MKKFKAAPAAIRRAAAALKNGGVAAFPTETVYGLGASAFDPKAAARIFEIKARPHFDPLIVHIASYAQLRLVASRVPKAAVKLARAFWPGPLTLVLPKSAGVPPIVTSGLPTVAVRMPAHPAAIALIKAAGPLAAPSANRFGRLSPTTAAHVAAQLGNGPDMILDGGPCRHGIESTIVAFEKGSPVILRHGAVPAEEIARVAGKPRARTAGGRAPAAPGQLKSHYAPAVPLRLLKAGKKPRPSIRAGYLAFSARPAGKFRKVEVLSPSGDLREAAAGLFAALHRLEAAKTDIIYAEPAPARGIGRAINDRLKRAAARE